MKASNVKKTIFFSQELDGRLKDFAQVTGMTESTVIRLALMSFIPLKDK